MSHVPVFQVLLNHFIDYPSEIDQVGVFPLNGLKLNSLTHLIKISERIFLLELFQLNYLLISQFWLPLRGILINCGSCIFCQRCHARSDLILLDSLLSLLLILVLLLRVL